MESTVVKRVTGNQMIHLFGKNNFIKFYNAPKPKDIEEVNTYHIIVRHNEDENPEAMLDAAIKLTKEKV